MLASSALSRLAATTLGRSLLARAPVALPPARASVAAHLFARRSYATSSSDAEPTETAKKAAKPKTRAASKTATTKKATTKKTTTKKAAPKKAAAEKPKKSTKAKKPKKAPGTPEEQAKEKFYGLRKVALLTSQPSVPRSVTGRVAFVGDYLKGGSDATKRIAEAHNAYNALSSAEKEHWDTVAADIKAARAAELRAWVESFSPDTIRAANLARTRMRAMLRDTPYKLIRFSGLQAIPDERRVLKPSSAWMLFCKDRLKDGDLDGKLTERTSAISAEYRALSEEQLKPYKERAAAESARYESMKAESLAKYGSSSSSPSP